MKRFLEQLREGDTMLQVGGLVAAAVFLLAGPGWMLYVYLLDLGAGGLGGPAEADTPAARSIAEMEQLDRFTFLLWGTADEFAAMPAVFVDGDAYWLVTLDSGETVAARFWPESIQWERRDGVYLTICPVGSWQEWKLSGESLAQLNRDAPQLTVASRYVDMVGAHRDGRNQTNFNAGFHTFSLVAGLAALMAVGLRQEKKREKKINASLPRDDLERWLTGACAIWGQFFAQLGRTPDGRRDVKARRGPIRFGGQQMDGKGQSYTRRVLKEDWEIENRKDLVETVEYMSAGPGFTKCGCQAARAWQLCRSMQLLAMGFVAGWYSREELVRRSCQVGRAMQEHFRSWDELCQGFLDGFFAWLSGAFGVEDAQAALQERRDIYRELQQRPDSPYRLSWYLPLNPESGPGGSSARPAWEK